MNELDKLINMAMELQSIAQNGLAYTRDAFDKERFERVREISAEIMAMKTELPLEKVKMYSAGNTDIRRPSWIPVRPFFRTGKSCW